jgi:hypothetical protein
VLGISGSAADPHEPHGTVRYWEVWFGGWLTLAEQTAPETARFDLQQANRPVEVQGSKIASST